MGARAKRLVFLVHRWTGIAGCLLMALWFVSGMVMLFVGYPKLTPAERLAPLHALAADCCLAAPPALAEAARAPGAVLALTTLRGEPHYVVRGAPGLPARAARTGDVPPAVTPAAAVAAAHAFAPGMTAHHAGELQEDRWTHSRGLNAHRPLHRVDLAGDAPTTLYVSSATGEVVMDAPLWQQRWNYAGAWLHWLYMFRAQSVDPVWSWIVIGLSALCTVSALAGMLVGIWRWRFQGRYKSGSRSPYREGWMHWHHVVGLVFGVFVCTWIFSGLMSMNPLGMFGPAHGRPDVAAYQAAGRAAPDALAPAAVLGTLQASGFQAVELQWRWLDGTPYVLAQDARTGTRLVRASASGLQVFQDWDAQTVLDAAQRLFAAPVTAHAVLTDYDAYYYARHAEAMNGGLVRGLPALRMDFADPDHTRVYVDLQTGEIATSLAASQRVSRWLFHFLHSWDTPQLLAWSTPRDGVILLLSLGGIVVSVSGVVIGWRRLRKQAH